MRLLPTTVASPDQSQNAPARPRPVEVNSNWRVCPFVAALEATGSSLLSLPAGDHKNSIVQWLSRSNTNFSVPKISSSKPRKLVSSVSSCSYHVPLLPLYYFFLSVSSEGLRQSNMWSMEEQVEFLDFSMLFLFPPHLNLLSLNYSFVSRAAMSCRPLCVLSNGGSDSVLLKRWVPPNVLQVLQQGEYQQL